MQGTLHKNEPTTSNKGIYKGSLMSIQKFAKGPATFYKEGCKNKYNPTLVYKGE